MIIDTGKSDISVISDMSGFVSIFRDKSGENGQRGY